MKKKGVRIIVSALVVLGLLIGGFGCAAPAPTPTKPFEWHVYHMTVPNTSYQELTSDTFPARISEATGGRIKILMAPELIKPIEAFEAIKTRRVDAAWICPAYLTGVYPSFGVGSVGNCFDSMEHGLKTLEKTGYFDYIGERMLNDFDAVLLSWGSWTLQLWHTTVPINTVESFRGLKLRTTSKAQAQLLEKLGGKPVGISWPEFYPALQTGVVDGGNTGLVSGWGIKIYEVTDYQTWWPEHGGCGAGAAMFMFAVNAEAWAELPEDLRATMEQACAQLTEDCLVGVIEEEKWGIEAFRSVGNVVTYGVDLDPAERAKMEPISLEVFQDWLAGIEKEGERLPPALLDYFGERGLLAK